jgi:hypothetical protein
MYGLRFSRLYFFVCSTSGMFRRAVVCKSPGGSEEHFLSISRAEEASHWTKIKHSVRTAYVHVSSGLKLQCTDILIFLFQSYSQLSHKISVNAEEGSRSMNLLHIWFVFPGGVSEHRSDCWNESKQLKPCSGYSMRAHVLSECLLSCFMLFVIVLSSCGCRSTVLYNVVHWWHTLATPLQLLL